MLHKFKLYGQRFVIDTTTGAVHKLSEISYDMLTYLRLPFENAFPSTLRYDLAKYESSKLAEAYMDLAKLGEDGVFSSITPLKVDDIINNVPSPQFEATYSKTKFVFATEVIKKVDEGFNIVSAKEDENSKVNNTDYDILALEYERIAKEIIKRKTGRIIGDVFTFTPFCLPFSVDNKGYTHLASSKLCKALEDGNDTILVKIIECAIAVYFA